MSIRESCDKALLLQAEFDGELDAAQSAALIGHRLGCAYCQDAWETLQESRREIRHHATYHPASTMLKDRLAKELAMAGLNVTAGPAPVPPAQAAFRRWWRSLFGFGLGAAQPHGRIRNAPGRRPACGLASRPHLRFGGLQGRSA